MPVITQRRILTSAEIANAMFLLHDAGMSYSHVALELGVTLGTLRRQLLQRAWKHYCIDMDCPGIPYPPDPQT